MRRLLILLTLFLTISGIAAQNLPDPMSPPRLVNDFAGLLSESQRNALEQKLEAFDKQTSTQIAVVTVTDLDGYAPSDYAIRLHEKWQVGRKGKDNGVLMLVKPRTDTKGEVFISVGYGLEGVIPDAAVSRILDNEVLPPFQKGDFYKGIDDATMVMMQLSAGEFTADEYTDDTGAIIGVLVAFVLFIVLAIMAGRQNKGGGNGGSSGGSGGRGFIPPIIIGGGSRGGFGGFGGGGGFGGFGGGMTGGGGGGRSF